jgi:class 3 adenylate cyclase
LILAGVMSVIFGILVLVAPGAGALVSFGQSAPIRIRHPAGRSLAETQTASPSVSGKRASNCVLTAGWCSPPDPTIDDHREAARSLQRYLGRGSREASLPPIYTTPWGTTRARFTGFSHCQKQCPGHVVLPGRSCAPGPREGAIMDLESWLRSLGLERYEPIFRENAIDADLLHHLTEDHLREMGLPLGARIRLRVAISALVSGAEPTGAALPAAPSGPLADTAERRQVTVMFSDLVGSTVLAVSMDPEDLGEIISAYQKCVAETVQRFGEFVAKYMGDGVLVHFGYPLAHEDDAERAVRAGLELIKAVSALESSALLRTRIGIATGQVVIGELIGSGYAQERSIVGKTPNLAARLQGVAEPNMVVICDSTRRLLGNLFDLEDLGPRDLRASPDRRGRGRPCGRVPRKAASKRCTPPA